MLKRLLIGLVLGVVVGGLAAFALMKGLGVAVFAAGAGGVAIAYLFAALTGALTGLLAGKPIWAKGAQIEAGLKAIFGALIAAGGMFALRQWVHTEVDLHVLAPEAHGAIGNLPAASLPVIAAILGAFFGLDNTDGPKEEAKGPGKGAPALGKASGANGKARVDTSQAAELDEDVEVASKKARR